MSLFEKLKRRNVFRSTLAYVVACWLLIEVLELVTDAFEAPAWVIKVFISVLVIGIVPVAVYSWMYEITPEGIRRETGDDSLDAEGTARRLDIAVLVMLTVAIGLFVQDRLSRDAPATQPAATAVTAAPAARTEGPPMIAVLPFTATNLQGDSEYFAIGVHDDLLTQLAKLESMRVISRTSVLEYRDTLHNIRAIGAALGADAILEGGVQAAGDRIRINAQLIEANTDEHLWAETYDRALTPVNIFEVQAEIARAIATALNATLTDQDDAQLNAIPTENMAAYRAFRRAMEIRHGPTSMNDPEYIVALEEAVRLDPEFSRAWAELAGGLAFENVGRLEPDPELVQRAENALERIRQLAPGSAEYLVAQAYYLYYILQDYDQADEVVTRAVALNPGDIHVLELKTWIQRRQGDFEGRQHTLQAMIRLDPRNPRWTIGYIFNFIILHRWDEARRELAQLPSVEGWLADADAHLAFREDGDPQRLLASLQGVHPVEPDAPKLTLWQAYLLNRDFEGAIQVFSSPDGQSDGRSEFLSDQAVQGILTFWTMGEQERLAEYLTITRDIIEADRDADGEFESVISYLKMALVVAAEGDEQEAMRLIQRWRTLIGDDWWDRIRYGVQICWIQAMLSQTGPAVDCLRTEFRGPSFTMPFLEPNLPFYDSIRDTPEFRALVAEYAD